MLTQAKYHLGNLETDWLKSVTSFILFSKYTEELAVKMRRMNTGVRIGKGKICMLLHVDDVVMQLYVV